MELDFSPLDEKDSKPIKSELTDIPKFNNLAGAIIVSIILAVVLIPITPFVVLIAPLIFVALYRYINNSGASAIRLSNFAVKNNFSYVWGMKNNKSPQKVSFLGVIGSESEQIPASNIINGLYKDLHFQLFNPFTKGAFTIMKINLKNQYPHIVLDSTTNDRYLSKISNFFSEQDRITLESNFNNNFKVYAKASPIDTLRILSPDMMALMIDTGLNFDIELIKDQLYLIGNFKFSNSREISAFFQVADSLLNKLDRRLATSRTSFDSESRVS